MFGGLWTFGGGLSPCSPPMKHVSLTGVEYLPVKVLFPATALARSKTSVFI